jgi:hypothetical protein
MSSLYDFYRTGGARTRRKLVFLTRMNPACRKGIGGAERNRTADPLLAKQVLYQLSYSPETLASLPESGAFQNWWAWEDSNFRPHAYQARALTN